jgi:hypothetical protein
LRALYLYPDRNLFPSRLYRLIGRNLGLSKNTVMQIIKRGSIAAAA